MKCESESLMLALQSLLDLASYRNPRQISEVVVFQSHTGPTGYYVCPRCDITLDREFMAYCDRCGQCLNWKGYRKAKVRYAGGAVAKH
jgi:uncharacterized paraquat-inducible protein A